MVNNNLVDRHVFWSKNNWPTDITFGRIPFVWQRCLLVKKHLSGKYIFWLKTTCQLKLTFAQRPFVLQTFIWSIPVWPTNIYLGQTQIGGQMNLKVEEHLSDRHIIFWSKAILLTGMFLVKNHLAKWRLAKNYLTNVKKFNAELIDNILNTVQTKCQPDKCFLTKRGRATFSLSVE